MKKICPITIKKRNCERIYMFVIFFLGFKHLKRLKIKNILKGIVLVEKSVIK